MHVSLTCLSAEIRGTLLFVYICFELVEEHWNLWLCGLVNQAVAVLRLKMIFWFLLTVDGFNKSAIDASHCIWAVKMWTSPDDSTRFTLLLCCVAAIGCHHLVRDLRLTVKAYFNHHKNKK